MNHKDGPSKIKEMHTLDHKNDSKEKAKCNKKEKKFKHGSKFCKNSTAIKISWSIQICT